MHRWTKAVMVAWFTLTVVLGTALAIATPTAAPAAGQLNPSLWTALALFAGIALLAIGRVGRRDNVASLEGFIADVATSLSVTRVRNHS